MSPPFLKKRKNIPLGELADPSGAILRGVTCPLLGEENIRATSSPNPPHPRRKLDRAGGWTDPGGRWCCHPARLSRRRRRWRPRSGREAAAVPVARGRAAA